MPAAGLGEAGWPPSPLWAYAKELYARPGVAALCLALQDGFGADVNLALFACWLGATGRAPGVPDLERARQLAAGWQADIVAPLRAARRALKRRLADLPDELREPLAAARAALAGAEIALERGELAQLERLVGAAGTSSPGPALVEEALRHLMPAAALGSAELAGLLEAAFRNARLYGPRPGSPAG